MTKIQLVKTLLKILAAFVSVVVLGFCWLYVLYRQDIDFHCDTFTINGRIGPETFVKARGCLARSTAPKKTFVVKSSEGGDNAAALALGILIHRHNWDVEVIDLCASACANFIFPAGKTKYLNQHALLMYHGGFHQANLPGMTETLGQGSSVTLGQVNKEHTITLVEKTPAYLEVHEFLSIPHDATTVEAVRALTIAADEFYRELGMNPLIGSYGQTGEHEPKYKSYEYFGFIYRLDSLRRFGIGNIELRQGEWHPERHPGYPKVYEVTYP